MNTFMTAAAAVEKLKAHTGIKDNAELAKALGVPATAINIFQGKTYSQMRAYKSLVFGAQKLGLDESFFYEDGDPTWTPAKPTVKVEVVEKKAVAVTPAETFEKEPVVVPEEEGKEVIKKALEDPVTETPEPAEEEKPASAVEGKAETSKVSATAPKVPDEEVSKFAEQAVSMIKAGMTRKEILQTLKVGKTTFYKYLKLAGVDVAAVTAEAPASRAKAIDPVEEAPAEEEAPVVEETVEETETAEPVTETAEEAPAEETVAEAEPETEPEAESVEEAEETESEPEAEAETVEEEEVPEAPAEEPEVPATKAVADDRIEKVVANLVESTVAEAIRKCGTRAEKLATLVEKASLLSDEKLDAIISLL